MTELILDPGKAPLSAWRKLAEGPATVSLATGAWARIEQSRALIEQALASGEAIYGVNTGFGKLAQKRIPDAELAHLQRNLVLSHAAGVGDPLQDGVVRLVMALKAASLARGHSGVRRVVVERLLEMLAKDLLPEIPSKAPSAPRAISRRWPTCRRC